VAFLVWYLKRQKKGDMTLAQDPEVTVNSPRAAQSSVKLNSEQDTFRDGSGMPANEIGIVPGDPVIGGDDYKPLAKDDEKTVVIPEADGTTPMPEQPHSGHSEIINERTNNES